MKYAINLLSMASISPWPQRLDWFPRCLFRDPVEAIEEAREAGYDGVQAYPVPGLLGPETNIICYEEFWGNPMRSLKQAVAHSLGLKRIVECLKVLCFSPSETSMARTFNRLRSTRATKVVHDFGDAQRGDIIEVHPAMGRTVNGIDELGRLGCRLCLDTLHLTRAVLPHEVLDYPDADLVAGTLPFGSCESEWLMTLRVLAPYARMIHIHPPSATEFTPNSMTFRLLQECLCSMPLNDDTILVAEYPPTLLTLRDKEARIATAEQFLQTMRQAEYAISAR